MTVNANSPQHSPSGKLVLLIGPSGVGKSVVLKKLREKHEDWVFPRSATTRKRRPREGDDLYLFVSEEEFDRLVAEGKFLEWARVHGGPPDPDGVIRAGARYGTLLSEIIPAIEAGKIVLREVDIQGFESIRKHPLFCRGRDTPYLLQSLFLLPENKEQLIARIKHRAPITEEELQRRLASMEKELAVADLCDARVVNREGKIEEAVSAMEREIVG